MKYMAMTVLLSLAALLSVGFMTVPEQSHHGSTDCVIAALDSSCKTTNQNMAVHHIGAYNSFTSIFISVFALLSLSVVFLFALCSACLKRTLVPVAVAADHSPQSTHLRRWLSLFINSPTV